MHFKKREKKIWLIFKVRNFGYNKTVEKICRLISKNYKLLTGPPSSKNMANTAKYFI